MTASIEKAVYDYLNPLVAAAQNGGGPLDGVAIDHTPYQPFFGDNGISILLHKAEIASTAGADDVEEKNGSLPIICFARVVGADKTNRFAARDKADAIYKAVATLLYSDPTLGGYCVFSRPMKSEGGWDEEQGQAYMVVTFELRFNDLTSDLNER